MLTYQDYINIVTPVEGVFTRKEKGIINNLVKWLGLRAGFVFYKLGITANLLDIIGIIISFFAFYLLMTSMLFGDKYYAVIGVMLIFFHVWIDYIDGAIAKASNSCSPVGAALDDIGCSMDRFIMLILLGIVTNNNIIVLANTMSSVILIILYSKTVDKVPDSGIYLTIKQIYKNNKSFLSVRFMLGLLPLYLLSAILLDWDMAFICTIISAFYIFAAAVWLITCIPNHENNEKYLTSIED